MTLSTLANGFVLGGSVTWPPGPINAEIIRRGFQREMSVEVFGQRGPLAHAASRAITHSAAASCSDSSSS